MERSKDSLRYQYSPFFLFVFLTPPFPPEDFLPSIQFFPLDLPNSLADEQELILERLKKREREK